MKPTIPHSAPLLLLLSIAACSSSDSEIFGNTLDALGDAEGVGDACTPTDEQLTSYPGADVHETILDLENPDCATGICLVNQFQGRVSCPEGGAAGECQTPDEEVVSVAVPPQLESRLAEAAVFCTCRCDGPEGEGPYCACPSGFLCQSELIADLGFENGLSGGYCVREPERGVSPGASPE